jgi:hypothetical protein
MTTLQSEILTGAVAQLNHWRSYDLAPLRANQVTTADRRWRQEQIALAAAGQVACAAAVWIGQPLTAASRVAVSRAYAALEAAGLIVRLQIPATYGQKFKTVALRITEAGERLAATLANDPNSPSDAGVLPAASIPTPGE